MPTATKHTYNIYCLFLVHVWETAHLQYILPFPSTSVGNDSVHGFTPETTMQIYPRFARAECEELQDEVRGLRTCLSHTLSLPLTPFLSLSPDVSVVYTSRVQGGARRSERAAHLSLIHTCVFSLSLSRPPSDSLSLSPDVSVFYTRRVRAAAKLGERAAHTRRDGVESLQPYSHTYSTYIAISWYKL